MTASRTARRSLSSRARKCSAVGAVCAGSIPSRMQCSVAAARSSSLCERVTARSPGGGAVSG
eukprot:2541924-Alexandrium_andersonii.AAC.1